MAKTATRPVKEQRPAHSPLDQCYDTLGEAYNEDVYHAIERLVQAGEQVGFAIHDRIRMLNGGMTLESLFDVIELRMAGSVFTKSKAS
jgi:hypothetical protein